MKIIFIIAICLLVIIATLIVIWGVVTKWKFKCKKKDSFKTNKQAIVVLTRGYTEKNQYQWLLQRNKYLEKYYNSNIDYVIYHEGNISKDHQKYINNETLLPLIFINVSDSFAKKKFKFSHAMNQEPFPIFSKNGEVNSKNLAYKNMINFWFCDFWNYVKKYEKILRIDEDCEYQSDYNEIFKLLDQKVSVYGKWWPDDEFVTKGLNNFTLDFLRKNNIKNSKSHKSSGPYTNVVGFNLDICRKNSLLLKYIAAIKVSENIYLHRWGDLPLWGEILTYFFTKNQHLATKKIQYFHKSHGEKINI